jgi:hypothetical protein
MEKTKGWVIWVTKEFKARQELRFDLHSIFLVMADRSPLAAPVISLPLAVTTGTFGGIIGKFGEAGVGRFSFYNGT